jgi:hypothetical protein
MCRVLPPIIARNPFLLGEVVKFSNRYSRGVASLDLQNIQRRIYMRIEEELLMKTLDGE